jgi:GAF domain-containing protein/anti-sigma regulatory factor (Ser/Thr protein kinase)
VRWFGTISDIHDERRTARQLQVIACTSSVLAESLDRDALLAGLAALVCDELAAFVLIVLIDDERGLRTAGTGHRDRAAAAAMRELHGRALLLPEFEALTIGRISRGETFAGVTDADRLAEVLLPQNVPAMAGAGAGAFVCAPLQARGRTLGAIVAYAPPGTVFGADESTLLTEIAARAAIAVENAELYEREHRVSATLQQALLPTRLPVIAGLVFDAIYEPGATEAQIGGDWYDAVELPDGRVIVSIGDVTGRGLRAAVIMGRVRQAIEALATYQSDPAQLLNAADAVLRRAHPDAIVTALVGVIDLKNRTFSYATAGHPTPIIRAQDGTLVGLPGTGLPLGLRDAHQPPSSTIVLPAHSLLFLFTDGLIESTRDIDEGERRIAAALRDSAIACSPHPAAAIKAAVLHDGSSDDVAVFTIGVGDLTCHSKTERSDSPLRSAWSMHWSFDARDARSTRDVRELFIAYLQAKGAPDADYAGAELVFGELLGNVVRHAPGVVEIEVEWRGDAPVLHVLDRGPGYDRLEQLPPTFSETGRGLYLVATLTREFTVTRLPGYGSHARAVLPINRTA